MDYRVTKNWGGRGSLLNCGKRLRDTRSSSAPHVGQSWSFIGQLFARLLTHHVLGIPRWPVGVGVPNLRFMLPMRHRGTNHCLCKVGRRCKCRVACDTAGKPLGNFLQQPAVAVRICEGNKGAVAETLGVWPGDSDADVWKPASSPGLTVKYLARINTACDEFLARSLNVGDG